MKLQVSNSPHVRDDVTTPSIMRDVVIALMPATIYSGYMFGLRAILMVMVSATSCLLFEYMSRKIMKRNNTLYDMSALVTGILLALNMPATLPFYMLVLAALFAIVVVKQFFGGLGNNFVNPAIAARIFLVISFPEYMSTWTLRSGAFDFFDSLRGADLVSSATPLASMNTLHASGSIGHIIDNKDALPSLFAMFIGERAGSIGEVSILALLIGAAYLLARKVITPAIPASYLGSFILLVLLFGRTPIYGVLSSNTFSLSLLGEAFYEPLYMLCSGGIVLGAFFMATDYVTSPLTNKGRVLFGIGCGILTFLIRYYANMPGGVSFAIILMNILTPHIDRVTMKKPFGGLAHERR